MKNRILVSGGNGFLGKYICANFSSQTYDMLRLERDEKSVFDEKTIRLAHFVNDIKKNGVPEVIINCLGCYGRNGESDIEILDINLRLCLQLLQYVAEVNIPYFININTALPENLNAYSLSKNQFSNWGKLYGESGKVNFIDLKMEHFYGPGCTKSNFITYLIESMLVPEPEIALTAGLQERNFIYISDVVNAIEIILTHRKKFPRFTTIPVGGRETISIKELALMIKEITGSKTELQFGKIPYRNNEVMKSCTDISLLEKLGWFPQVDIRQGINNILRCLQ